MATHQEYLALAELSSMISDGDWVFLPRPHADTPIVGVHEGSLITDVVVTHGPDDTTVARLSIEDRLAADLSRSPWWFTGELGDAIKELKALPTPDHPDASRLRQTALSQLLNPIHLAFHDRFPPHPRSGPQRPTKLGHSPGKMTLRA